MSGRASTIEYKDSLPDDSAGGIIGSTMQGRIKVDNTLNERLKILEEKMLPELREDLFGKNPNRKFYTVSRRSTTAADDSKCKLMQLLVPIDALSRFVLRARARSVERTCRVLSVCSLSAQAR